MTRFENLPETYTFLMLEGTPRENPNVQHHLEKNISKERNMNGDTLMSWNYGAVIYLLLFIACPLVVSLNSITQISDKCRMPRMRQEHREERREGRRDITRHAAGGQPTTRT